MAKNTNRASFNPELDRILGKPTIVHLSEATGQRVSGPGEGVMSLCLAVRSYDGGAPKVAIEGCYVAAKDGAISAKTGEGWSKSVLTPNGVEHRVPRKGDVVLSGKLGRLTPALSAAVFSLAAQFSAAVAKAQG